VIRFSAFLVAVAIGLLIAGVVTSDLKLVYAAIGVSGVAFLTMCVGWFTNRRELFGQPASTQPVSIQPAQPASQAPPWEASASASSASASSGWSTAGAQPAGTTARAAGAAPWKNPPAAFSSRPPAGAPGPVPGAWEWRQDAPVTQPLPRAVSVPAAASPAADPDPPTVTFAAEAPEATEAADHEQPDKQQPAADIPSPTDAKRPAEDPPPPEAGDEADEQAPDQLTQQLPVPAAYEPAADEPAAVDLEREVTVVPGVPRYHNAQCLLIRFMDEGDLGKMTLRAAQKAGCTPCRACLPDQPEASA
jgi:hypothetical protein